MVPDIAPVRACPRKQYKMSLPGDVGEGRFSLDRGIGPKLGASNMMIGLLAAIGPLSQLLQLPSVALIEKICNRRAIVVAAAGLGRAS